MKAFEEIRDAEERASAITDDAEREAKKLIASASERGEELLERTREDIYEREGSLRADCLQILSDAKKKSVEVYAEEEKRITSLAEKNMDKAVELVFKRMVAQWQ